MTAQFATHAAFASSDLTDALTRLESAERRAIADATSLALARAKFDLVKGSDDEDARTEAAKQVAAAELLHEASCRPCLDAEGQRVVRRALASALRYSADRAEYAPVQDPRDKPHPISSVFGLSTSAVLEAQGRANRARQLFAPRVLAFEAAPERFSLAALLDLFDAAATTCGLADQVRASLPAPVKAEPMVGTKERRAARFARA